MITDTDKETIGKYLQRELGGKLVTDWDDGNRRNARIEEFENIKDSIIDKKIIKFYEENGFIKDEQYKLYLSFSESHLIFRKKDTERYIVITHTYHPIIKNLLITEDRKFFE